MTVTYAEHDGTAHVFDLAPNENVVRGALAQDLPGIVGECGSGLACATCHCYVDNDLTARIGGPSPRVETYMLGSTAAEINSISRLSCQVVRTLEQQY